MADQVSLGSVSAFKRLRVFTLTPNSSVTPNSIPYMGPARAAENKFAAFYAKTFQPPHYGNVRQSPRCHLYEVSRERLFDPHAPSQEVLCLFDQTFLMHDPCP